MFTYDLYIMDADGTNQTRITTLGWTMVDPMWSPDGTKILFHDVQILGGDTDIHVVNIDGSNLTQITTGGDNLSASWSPDGNQIAFTSSRDGSAQIYVMNPDGTNVTRLTFNSEFCDESGCSYFPSDSAPGWSPDGSKIVFQSTRGSGGIYVMNSGGSGITDR